MRVLMTGGGTAGHVNPAIAIANTIKKHDPQSEIEFVASNQKNDKARELVPRAGYKLRTVDICGSYPIWNPQNIKTAVLMIRSARQARAIIKEFKPDIIIGTGGFACYPLLNAGADLGIPTLVHESNAIPGRAVRKLAGKLDCVMTNFQSTADTVRGAKRLVRVGNPSVLELSDPDGVGGRDIDGFSQKIISFGGSGGAENLNTEMCRVISSLADKYPTIQFYHAAGKRDIERTRELFASSGLLERTNVVLVEYIYDMSKRMREADLVICRAGAMTISELALMGKAAILVPSPFVAANHQYKNAKALLDANAAELVEESEFASGKLVSTVESLISDGEKRELLGKNILDFAAPDANDRIYQEILRLVRP